MADEIVIKYVADTAELEKRLKRLEDGFDDVGDEAEKSGKKAQKSIKETNKETGALTISMDKLAIAVAGAFAVGRLIEFGREMTNLAVTVETTAKRMEVVFEGSAKSVEKAARQMASSLGLSNDQFKLMATQVGDVLKPLGLSAKEAAKMSIEAVKLAGALSEFSAGQVTMEQATHAMVGAFTGEREALKTLGVVIQEVDVQARLAKKGQQDLEGQALASAKAMATFELITEKSADAQTFFAENSGSLARQTAETRAQIQTLREDIARKLTPTIQSVTKEVLAFLKTLSVQDIINLTRAVGSLVSGIVAYKVAVTVATTVTKAFGRTFNALPLGLIIGGLASLSTWMGTYSQSARDAERRQNRLNASLEKSREKMQGYFGEIKKGLQTIDEAIEKEIELARARGKSEKDILDLRTKGTERYLHQAKQIRDEEREIHDGLKQQKAELEDLIDTRQRHADIASTEQRERGLNMRDNSKEIKALGKDVVDTETKAVGLMKEIGDQLDLNVEGYMDYDIVLKRLDAQIDIVSDAEMKLNEIIEEGHHEQRVNRALTKKELKELAKLQAKQEKEEQKAQDLLLAGGLKVRKVLADQRKALLENFDKFQESIKPVDVGSIEQDIQGFAGAWGNAMSFMADNTSLSMDTINADIAEGLTGIQGMIFDIQTDWENLSEAQKMSVQSSLGEIGSAFRVLGEEFKELAVLEIIVTKALAISQAIQLAVASSGTPWLIALNIASAISSVLIAWKQVDNILTEADKQSSQGRQGFARGVVGLRGEGSGTGDMIPVNLSAGESVMTANNTRKYYDELSAIHSGTFDKLINSKYIMPELAKMNPNIVIDGGFTDRNLINNMRKDRELEKKRHGELMGALTKRHIPRKHMN